MKHMIEHNRHFTREAQASIRKLTLPEDQRHVATEAINRLEICLRGLDDMEKKWDRLHPLNGQMTEAK